MSQTKLVRGRWVVTGGGAEDAALTDHAVVVEGDRITDLGPWQTLRAARPQASVIGSDDVAVIPGLVNAHHHTYGVSSIQQGLPDQLLEPWILSFLRMRPGVPRLDALLSAASQLRSGVTSVVNVHSGGGDADAYAGEVREQIAGYDESGLRVAFAAGLMTQSFLISGKGEDERFVESLSPRERELARARLPGADRITEDEYFDLMAGWIRDYRNHPRVDIWFAPPGPQWVSDACLQRIAERAAQLDTGVQTHVEESIYEMAHGPRFYGKHTLLHLHELGVLSPRFSIAHGVWLTEAEIEVMADTGTALSHNPSSNLRLRAGIAPLNALLSAGVTTGLGMDATTLNEDEDMFTEMRLAMRLHRTPRLDGPAPEPAQVLGMATAGGARLMRRDTELGRIAPGYLADLVLVDLGRATWPWVAPEADPRELLLLRAGAGDVRTVLIGGDVVLENGLPTRFDLREAGRELAEHFERTPVPTEGAAAVDALTPHLEAWYRSWPIPPLEPWTRYNTRR